MQLGNTAAMLLRKAHYWVQCTSKSWITPCGLLSTQRTFLFRDRLIFPHLTSEEQIHARLVPPRAQRPLAFGL